MKVYVPLTRCGQSKRTNCINTGQEGDTRRRGRNRDREDHRQIDQRGEVTRYDACVVEKILGLGQ